MVNKDYHFYMLCTVMDHDFCSEKKPFEFAKPDLPMSPDMHLYTVT